MYGHSAGGLIVSLWLDRLRRRGATAAKHVNGLVLNSPWLDLQGPAILRTAGTAALIGAVSRFRKKLVARSPTEGGYGTSLHRDYHGEFDYDLNWKPVGGFPVTFGWINAIRRGHARLHRGLDVGVPNLILRSDHSVREVPDPELIQRGDAVLDVEQIARWAGCIGNRTTVVPIVDAKHDVFLSLPEPRAAAFRELDNWLDWYTGWSTLGRRVNTIRTRMTRWNISTSRSSAPARATRSSTSATPRSASRSANRAPSAERASTSAASRPRCSSTPPRSPRRSGTPGVSASTRTLDGVRWSDIVSRVFGRIDPIAMGGENYRRSSPNVTVYDTPHPVRPSRTPTAATRCAPTPATSSPPTRW